jgi:hypothetical protein
MFELAMETYCSVIKGCKYPINQITNTNPTSKVMHYPAFNPVVKNKVL